jgi:hypothetical protein
MTHPAWLRDTLKKSSFPRRRESRGLILLGFAFGKNDFAESISASLAPPQLGGSWSGVLPQRQHNNARKGVAALT